MSLIGAEFMFFYSLSGNFIFYYGSIGVFAITIIYASKYYREFKGFRETLAQGLYFPNSNNHKPFQKTISKSLEMEVEDLPLKACLLYRNSHSFDYVSKALKLGHTEKARIHKLNISRITEQVLTSILDYLETQNTTKSSKFLSEVSFQKKVPWAGSSVWHERRLRKAEVAGSNPARSTIQN
jgi:hypothetical protein